MNRSRFLHRMGAAMLAFATLGTAVMRAQMPEPAADFKATFLRLCDVARAGLAEDTLYKLQLHRMHYVDSYAVRALAAAYDLTGDERDLKACEVWSNKMIDLQEKMTPRGAYYMNYSRKPGETTGEWYVADSSSIAMGVLATAVRERDPALHAKYLDSVKRFAELVLTHYVRKDGGVSDGCWEKYDGSWWCSTALFGSLSFLLYDECGDCRYLEAGLHAIDWLNGQELDKTEPLGLSGQGASLIMYFFEAYSAGLHDIPAGSDRRTKMLARIQDGIRWCEAHNHGDPGGKEKNYNAQWGSKAAGLPFHLYNWSRSLPQGYRLTAAADSELSYVAANIFNPVRFKTDKNNFSQQMAFAMMSFAEKLGPDLIYRR